MNVAIIPSRRGSTGLFLKNMRVLGGKTLLQRAIDIAKAASFDRIVVVSDDHEAEKVAKVAEVQFVQEPESLADDESLEKAVVLAAKKSDIKPDHVCVLAPSSPLRSVDDVVGTRMLFKVGIQTTMTVTIEGDGMIPRLRNDRRNIYHASPWFALNWRARTDRAVINEAAIWVDAQYLLETGHLIGPKIAVLEIPKWRAIEIRDYWDMMSAEAYFSELKKRGEIDG